MDFTSLLVGLIIGAVIGGILGYVIGKLKSAQPIDLSGQSGLLSSLNSQVAEMKGKFLEMEKARQQIDQQRAQYDAQREQRLKEWIENTQKLFTEQADKGKQVDEAKDKRIQDWMESTKKFFEEQKSANTTFLEQQGKSREEIETKRDAQLKDMSVMIQQVTRTIHGTKQRGIVGEDQLREVLSHCIQACVVVSDLKTDSGIVEFAWNLEDGKFIPIDCKLPDVFELLDQYDKSEDITEQKNLKSEIIKKIEKEIKEIQKYRNQTNTIDSCILVVPEGVLEMVPEIVGSGRETNVFVCSYKEVFPVSYLIQEKYRHNKELGDIGEYREIITTLLQIFDSINKLTDTINRGLVMITNANNSIKQQILLAKQKPKGIPIVEIKEEKSE
ncbi:DNA recombination protein RmuC [Methanoregula sp. UBA64]|jgi:DNA recombination protein RmuC|uniref:DNA recombination protein RmuC n=1 Tax=Methanoregula sp. UBA64 TaxID=1915554 RepID=UPI0025D7D143|nr:DNA recombination protein RmuC [Methanoregula sp. UBA64]